MNIYMYVQDTNKRFKNTNESKQIEKNPSKETFHINFKILNLNSFF